MAAGKGDGAPPPEEPKAAGAGPAGAAPGSRPALAGPKDGQRPDTGQPGGGQGRVDVTGIIPEGVRVDPDITEGHPGYQESGDSEIIPAGRPTGGAAAEAEGPAG